MRSVSTTCNVIILGNEQETKKSRIVSKICESHNIAYDDKQSNSVNINIHNAFSTKSSSPTITFSITDIDISEKYNLSKRTKSTRDKEIKRAYNSSHCILIAYNTSNVKSFQKAQKYYDQYKSNINNMHNANIIVALLGHRFGSFKPAQNYAKSRNILFHEISVNDSSIDSLFQNIGQKYILNEKEVNQRKSTSIDEYIIHDDKSDVSDTNFIPTPSRPHSTISASFTSQQNKLIHLDETEIKEMYETNKEHENTIVTLENSVSSYKRDKQQLEIQRNEYESQATQLRVQNTSQQKQIEDLEQKNKELLAENEKLIAKMAELKNKNLSNQTNNDENIDTPSGPDPADQTEKVQAKVSNHEQLVEELREKVTIRDSDIKTLRQINSNLTDELTKKQKQINHLQKCLDKKEKKKTKTKQKKEWKITDLLDIMKCFRLRAKYGLIYG